MKRYLLAFAIGLLAGLWEVSVLPFLPSIWGFRPLLPIVVLLLVSSTRSRALAAAVAGGMMLDLYHVAAFDLAIFRWLFLVFVLDLLIRHLFTNRSLYVTAALVVIGRLIEYGTAWLFGNLVSRFGAGAEPWGREAPWVTLGWDVLSVTIGFLILAFLTRRFLTLVHRYERPGTLF
jgi:hypothetical protein